MPRKYIGLLILLCIALNAAGFLWKLFEPVPLYDEVPHFQLVSTPPDGGLSARFGLRPRFQEVVWG